MQQQSIRNTTTIGESVHSHSGEFMPFYTDLNLRGRGLDFNFTRYYRSSLTETIGKMGRGWSSNTVKKIAYQGDDILYHDGTGETHKFGRKRNRTYESPTGFYGSLLQDGNQFLIHQRYGLAFRFENPEEGGRVLSKQDRNNNDLLFSYSENSIIVLDSLKRKVRLAINNGLLQELKDHTGRKWTYLYDKSDCLIEVLQPATSDFPDGTSLRYDYDSNHRLKSIMDAKGQKYVVNDYDSSGRVIAQRHGSGMFRMEYEMIDQSANGFPIYRTTCIRKNGSKLLMDHNSAGNVVSRTLFVSRTSFMTKDILDTGSGVVPLITKSTYNKHSELISRTFPTGDRTEWIYSEDEKNLINQGNILKITRIPQKGAPSDQEALITQYEFEPKFQFTTKVIDPRGNQTTFRYDAQGNLILATSPAVTIQPVSGSIPRPLAFSRTFTKEYQYNLKGQILRKKHLDGSITEYFYYPANDPTGKAGMATATNDVDKPGGYLAGVVQDANGRALKTEYAYDKYGHVATVWDGKGNPVLLRYNAMGKLERITGRGSTKKKVDYKYDANYNEIESIQAFERLEYDEKNRKTVIKSSTLCELKVYNILDNLILRKIVGGDKVITEHFTRDTNENIVRQVQPLGNTTEYKYDERDLLVEKKLGTGTRETFTEHFTYTLNNALRTYTDGNDKITMHQYDGFHRYKGFTNAAGLKKTQWFDESDNIVRIEIDGENRDSVPLMATKYTFDQWNRVLRIDKTWRDSASGQELGQSKWDGETGIVSTVIEYAENGLPGKVWTESDNVVAAEYDGVGRIVKVKDLTGEESSFEYDENNNPTLMKYLGPEMEGRRCEREIRRSYDAMDRLTGQQENGEASERFEYNMLGNIINYVGKSGIEIHHLEDVLGRSVGQAFTITDALNTTTVQKLLRRFEYDDNYRITAYTDASGNRTLYCYDSHDRQTRVISPNGNIANVEYDANGNIVREVDENNNEINNRYDASNRLVERHSLIKNSGKESVEQFKYDGLNRLIAAIAPDATIQGTYDSLSRLLTEQQGDHLLRYDYDSTGNITSLVYPGSEAVHKAYDIRNRVTSVKNKTGETIASFTYRANDQIADMWLGNVIKAGFSYNQQEHLESVAYQRTDNQELVEGFRYQYDQAGRITHEIQLREGPAYGERYYYDDANRATKAQYGVQDVFDPNSAFEQQTSYEHFPEGSWQHRVDSDGQGGLIDDQRGTINQLNNYQDFGSLAFAYDANGNCIRKGKSNPGYCDYTYDQDNRLIRSECYDAQGDKIQTIDYFYDAFGRQVRKVVTDRRGNVTEYTYVWAGTMLLEEYENGVLVRTYFYGIGSIPIQLSLNNGRQSGYYYTHNGKGLASGLLHQHDPYAFAEKYGYELTGASYMKEINGVKVGLPSRHSTNSSVANSILSGTYLKDWANASHSSIGGRHTNPDIAAVLNGAGKGHGGVLGVLNKQTNDYLNMIGRGSHGSGPTGAGTKGGLPPGVKVGFRAPNQSLYGDKAADDAANAANIAYNSAYKAQNDALNELNKAFDAKLNAAKVEKAASDAFFAAMAARDAAEKARDLTAIAKKAADDAAATKKEAEDKAKKEAEEEAKKKSEEEAKKKAEEEKKKKKGGAMADPDSGFGAGSFMLPSPQQVEAKLMQTKRPMNPNGGIGGPEISQSEGPVINKWDLISLYDGELSVIGDLGGRTVLIGGGYTTTVRGWDPFTPEVDPTSGGGINPVAQHFP